MIKSLKKLILGADKPPGVQIHLTRNTFIETTAGEKIPGSAGDTYEVPGKLATRLEADGSCVIVGKQDAATAHRAALEAILPAPVQPEPVPESWASLPVCFSNWWNLAESRSCLFKRHAAIEKMVCGALSFEVVDYANRSMPDFQQRNDFLLASIGANAGQGAVSESDISRRAGLHDALKRAAAALSDFDSQNMEALQVAAYECSAACIGVYGDMRRASREVQATGFSLFQTRIAALGLADWKARELFNGSADFVRYHEAAIIPDLQGLRLAWIADDGNPQHYLDYSPQILASFHSQWTARVDELRKLAAAAKAELTKATKATAA